MVWCGLPADRSNGVTPDSSIGLGQKKQRHSLEKHMHGHKGVAARKKRTKTEEENQHSSGMSDQRNHEQLAASLGRQSRAIRDEGQALGKAVEKRMIVLSSVLPCKYMKGTLVEDFLKRSGVGELKAAINRINRASQVSSLVSLAASSKSGVGLGAKGLSQGVKAAGKIAFRGAKWVGSNVLTGGAAVGRSIATIRLVPDAKTLVNLGYSRAIAKTSIERMPNPAGLNVKASDEVVELQIREAMAMQVERDNWVANRAARLKENPHLGMIMQKQALLIGRGIVDLIKRRKRDNPTEEEKRNVQLAALRRDLYGEGGLPSEDIDLESSDDEDMFGNAKEYRIHPPFVVILL